MRKLSGKESDFYHTPRWERLKRSVLAENKYMCQECKKKGIFMSAEHVHHIFPREQYPEYAFERWNLIPLCRKCHNEMHNRYTNELSKRGEFLRKETALMQGFDISDKKKTILVIGLRGCGKTTYVKDHLDGDSLAYDMDAIASAFRLRSIHEEYYKPARKMANDFLGGFIAKAHEYVKNVYIIRTAPSVKEFTMIDPDELVVCCREYVYREMEKREEAAERIKYVKEYAEKQGVLVHVQA